MAAEVDPSLLPASPLRLSSRPAIDLPSIGRFGPFEVVGRLAMGGMAEILLARETTRTGPTRYLVVKRILSQYLDDPDFVGMFLDEARVLMRLSHPNICHVYRFGEVDGTHYIAMEWINGAPIGRIIRRARDAGGVPVPIAVRIAALVAEALHHAHNARAEDGQPLELIHRDVSPHNIMVSYDGSVKLLDFGIAKAEQRAHQTTAGAIKGKFAYMAPEQCRGKAIDHRIDVFALGVCLFEMLTGKALYRREHEMHTMQAIVEEPVPALREQLPDCPPELDEILQKALAKAPEDRYGTAADFQDALERFLARGAHVVNASSLTRLMEELFHEEIRRGPSVDSVPFGSSYNIDAAALASLSKVPDEPVGPKVSGTREIDMGFDAPELSISSTAATGRAARPPEVSYELEDVGRGRAPGKALSSELPAGLLPGSLASSSAHGMPTWSKVGGAVLLVALVAAIGVGVSGRLGVEGGEALAPPVPAAPSEPHPPEPVALPSGTATLLVASAPPGARVHLAERETLTTPATFEGLAPGDHVVVVELEGHRSWAQSVTLTSDEATAITARLESLGDAPAAGGPMGRLTLDTQPTGARMFVAGDLVGVTPFDRQRVPSGILEAEFELPTGERVRRALFVRPTGETRSFLDLTGDRR